MSIMFAYILKSLKDNKYYYGSCENLDHRLAMHNSGRVKSTKHRAPFVVHYFETFDTRSEAQKREYFFKSVDGYRFLKDNNIT